jgi:ParB-like chromosome segregation protein Spo0J
MTQGAFMTQKKSQVQTLSVVKIKKNKFLLETMSKSPSKANALNKIIEQLGNALPVIVVSEDNHFRIVQGQDKFEGMVKAGYKEIPACIVDIDDSNEVCKATLNFLINYNNSKNAIAESKLIRELLNNNVTRAEILQLTGKSKTWLSKRESLLKNLSPGVQEMTMEGLLHTRAAEKIGQLPKEKQVDFSTKVIDGKLSTKDIATCVDLYNKKTTTNELKDRILKDPLEVIEKENKKKKYKKSINHKPMNSKDNLIHLENNISELVNNIKGKSKEEILEMLNELKMFQNTCVEANKNINKLFAKYKINKTK